MERAKRSLLHRCAIGVGVLFLCLIALYIAWEFVTVFILSVFLYYAVRPIHNALTVLHLPRRVRAGLSLIVFGLPFILLTAYSLTLIVVEAQSVFNSYNTNGAFIEEILLDNDIEVVDENMLYNVLSEIREYAELSGGILSVTGVLNRVSSLFVQFLVLTILTYTMLVDGARFKQWVVDTVDHGGVLQQYCEVTDRELASTLFGNIVNVFITGIIAVVVFITFNLYTPGVTIPYPGLLGALAGIGSLIPVIGIKMVYIPLSGWLVWQSWTVDGGVFFTPIIILFIVSVVLIDFIPDMFIRALVSGDETHTETLIAAYIIGPTVLGLYGLFLAPILLVLLICAGKILVPYVLHGELPENSQTTFGKFEQEDDENTTSEGLIRSLQIQARDQWEYVLDSADQIRRSFL